MGRNNQQRRAEKKRKAGRRGSGPAGRGGGRWEGGDGGPGDLPHLAVGDVVWEAARASDAGDAAGVDWAVEELVRTASRLGVGAVARDVGGVLAGALAGLWEGGWQPLEVVHLVRRRRRDAAVPLVVAALGAPQTWERAAGAAMPAAWSEQLGALGATPAGARTDWLLEAAARRTDDVAGVVRIAIEAVAAVWRTPVVEALLPRPSTWSEVGAVPGPVCTDDAVLAKVRSLLAKAESTSFEPEAEALTAKAQELMSRHSIDDAVTRSADATAEVPVTRRVLVDDPYADAKATLLRAVAGANGVRCVLYQGLGMVAVVGFATDLDGVELLFTSLLLQASRAMLGEGSVTDRTGRSRTRSYRQSFLLAFAGRIGERLHLAAAAAQAAAQADAGVSLLPVLAGRDQQVDDALAASFPHLTSVRGKAITNADGWRAGRVAAELATLGPTQPAIAG